MAKAAGMSHTMVGRIWRTFGLQPHVIESFKLSPDPQLVAKVRDVVGLYMHPPHNAVVFSVDEKPQIQALQRAQPILPMDHRAARTADPQLPPAWHARSLRRAERRHGRGPHAVHAAASRPGFRGVPPRHRRRASRPSLEIHVVLDNLSAHKAPAVHRWLLRHPRVHFHFTPTYASWLNLVERFFGLLTAEGAQARVAHQHPPAPGAILAYVEAHNERAHALQVGQDRRRDPRQDAPLRAPRAAGIWTMTRTCPRNHRSRGLGQGSQLGDLSGVIEVGRKVGR